jgi:hypothetical protein
MAENDDLSKQDILRVAPNAALFGLGTCAHSLAFGIQENLYGRSNVLSGVARGLEETMKIRPDFLTSFTGPFALMQSLEAAFLLGQMQSEKFSHTKREMLFRVGKFLAPIAVALVFVLYEASGNHLNGMEYLDSSKMDNVATMASLGFSMVTALTSEKFFWKSRKKPNDFNHIT